MLSALQKLPPLFACGPDPKPASSNGDAQANVYVSACLSEDGSQLEFLASGSQGKYAQSFDEAGMTKVKAGASASMQWEEFFHSLEKGFASKELSLQYDGAALVCSVPIGSVKAPFQLRKSHQQSIAGQAQMFQALYDSYAIRTDKTQPDSVLAGLQKKEQEWQDKVASLNQEKLDLTQSVQEAAREERQLNEKHDRLMQEMRELQEQQGGEGGDLGEIALEPDFTTCVGRLPSPQDCRDYDTDLLTYIKSSLQPKDRSDGMVIGCAIRQRGSGGRSGEDGGGVPEEEVVCNKVIRPWSSSELSQRMSALHRNERGVVMDCLKKLDQWDFDVFTIQDFTDKGSLFVTAYALFVRYDFIRKFNLDEQIVINFLTQVEAGYHPNPYHNSMHAADVLHILHYIISPGGLLKIGKLTDDDVFAALIAGMIHDYDHPGINNNFHIKVQSYLATLYNDRSILENHHCAEVFEIMKCDRFNLLGGLGDDQRRDLRETIIEMVLSTDMGLHAKILGNWKRRITQDMDLHNKKEDQRLALAMSIKMADISNCGRPQRLYLKWATKIAEEFFLQGDRERNLNNPVSPFMDRCVPSMARGQIAFMNYIVIPLFETISEYLPDIHFSVEHCEQNKSFWQNNSDDIT